MHFRTFRRHKHLLWHFGASGNFFIDDHGRLTYRQGGSLWLGVEFGSLTLLCCQCVQFS